ncbi:MAG: hypothetical protein KIT54_07635 [Phycisphaeraceae bacterium]|nr:hypothetical protein [Phycisphaeraceae bacterium]
MRPRNLIMSTALLASPVLAQSLTLECAAFTSGGTTGPGGDLLVFGQAFVGSVGSPGVALDAGLLACMTGSACRADIDGDGQLTIFDFLAFQNLFAAGDMRADFDGDGELTLFDFLAFQNEFAAGCP